MRIWVRGDGRMNLPKKSFVGQGGQASVYAQSGVAYKIYTDPQTMIPEGKIAELSAITDSRVIRPDKVISATKSGPPIGYTMPYVQDSFVLCQLFSRAFRTRHGIDAAQILHLVGELQEGIAAVHRAGALLVDGNELNFLVSSDFESIYFVDVDSYQTQSYPASAIMDSIRDRHQAAGAFSQESDWFSFAIVAFQLFVGIHPYKGKHPSCRGFDARMQANLSVLNSEVRVPKSTYPLSSIPKRYKRWFREVLEAGKRTPPPPTTNSIPQPVVFVAAPVLNGAALRYEELESRDSEIRTSCARGPHLLTVTTDAIWNHHRKMAATPEDFVGIAFDAHDVPLAVSASRSEIRVQDLENGAVRTMQVANQSVLTHEGRIYVHHGSKVSEVRSIGSGRSAGLSLALAVNVLAHATQLWPGFVLQNLLGKAFVSLLPKAGFSYQVGIPELSGATLVDARFQGKVLVATAHRGGEMDRLIFRFDASYQRYDCRVVKSVEVATANLTVLDSGLCLCLNEDEELEIFPCQMGSTKLELITDTSLCGEMKLSSRGAQALVTSQGSLYRIEMA